MDSKKTADPTVDALHDWNEQARRLRRSVLVPGGVLAVIATLVLGLAHVSGYLPIGGVRGFSRVTVAIAIGGPFVLVVGATWGIYSALLVLLRRRFLTTARERFGLTAEECGELRPFLH